MSELSSFLDENMLKLLIGIGAAVIGAVLTQLASAYAADRKIKEVELVYQQKIRDSYLENARKAAPDVYIPISIALTDLLNKYGKFSLSIDFKSESAPYDDRGQFEVECVKYLELIDGLMSRGADVYLTIDLDYRLQRFNEFLRESLRTQKVITNMILQTNFSALPFVSASPTFETKSDNGLLRHLGARRFFIKLPGLGSLQYSQEILAAPLTTRQFEERLKSDILATKLLIKEVTLGSHAVR